MKKQRESGVELIKVMAMLLVVIGHTTQTLNVEARGYSPEYVITYRNANHSIQNAVLSWMAGFGTQGNVIFFVCSAWFLLESDKVNAKKVLRMLLDVWVVNMTALFIFAGLGGQKLA